MNIIRSILGRRKAQGTVEVIPTRDGGASVQILRGRSLEEIVRLGPNQVHAMIRRADGSVEDLGVSENLRTTAGLDWQADVMGNPTQPAPMRYIGLTTNTGAPAAGDTTLTGEIASGGLSRASATYAHTPGASSFTLTVTFTSSGTHTAVHKAGLFSAASSGIMGFETNLNADATLASADQLTVTWTINI